MSTFSRKTVAAAAAVVIGAIPLLITLPAQANQAPRLSPVGEARVSAGLADVVGFSTSYKSVRGVGWNSGLALSGMVGSRFLANFAAAIAASLR